MRMTLCAVMALAFLTSGASAQQAPAPPVPPPAPPQAQAQPSTIEIIQNQAERALTERAIMEAMRNNTEERILASKLGVLKVQADILKAQNDVAKYQKDIDHANNKNGFQQQAESTSENLPQTPQENGSHVSIPAMSISWIAGPTAQLQAQIKISGYGQVVINKGDVVPSSGGLIVDSITSKSVILKDPSRTAFYSVPFNGSKM